jgi:hypothetical protein
MKKLLMPNKAYSELSQIAVSEGRTPETILEKMFALYEWYHEQEGNGSGDAGTLHYTPKDNPTSISSSISFKRGKRGESYHSATRTYGDPKPEISEERSRSS